MKSVSLSLFAVVATFLPTSKGECLSLESLGSYECTLEVLQDVSQQIYGEIQDESMNAKVVELRDDVALEDSAVVDTHSRSLTSAYCQANECTPYHAEGVTSKGYYKFCDKIGCEIVHVNRGRRGLNYAYCMQLQAIFGPGVNGVHYWAPHCGPILQDGEDICTRWTDRAREKIMDLSIEYKGVYECEQAILEIVPKCASS